MEAEWRDYDDQKSIDSEGKLHKTYHGDSYTFNMILMCPIVFKVGWMMIMMMNGGTVMILKLSKVKVSLMKLITKSRNTFKMILIVKVRFIKHMEIRNTEIHSLTKTILRTVFVSKVSPITMKTQGGDSVIIMIPATVRVSPMKLIMEIQSRMKMILTTLFVLKVSWMTIQKQNGETVMIKKLLIVKVNLMKHIMKIRNTFKMILMTLFVLKVSWMTMMKMNGKTVMIINLSIMKVNLMEPIM